ncbi:MAG: sulfotransferase domain-containing protein [Flavobacteriales bacterium]|nr:sulfotransferase domain-containing protein [Flavobacteriales bacterium]
MEGRLPNLLIIGAMKAGTSSLHDYLSLHPDIYMSTPKEIHYYADADYLTKTKEWYTSFFKTDKKIAGTTPQSYTKCHNKYYQHIPERIFKDTPDVKMIYIVRDPIKRYQSHIKESHFGDPKEDIRYSESIDHYIKTSMYYMQINEYLKYFKLEQIHVLSLEDLATNKLTELNKIFLFLGVKELTNEQLFNFKANEFSNQNIPSSIRTSYLFRLGNKILPGISRKIASRFAKYYYKKLEKRYELSDERLTELTSKLRDDVEQFRRLTGKEFKEWSI